jgi:hypothetical protein
MTKAEMEWHHSEYTALMNKARDSLQQGLYRHAVEFSLATWEHIDGMMQYARKYEQHEFASIESIDLILRIAPMLLDYKSLDSLETLLKDHRRITRNTSNDLTAHLTESRQLMRDAHRMWDHLERNPESRQDDLRKLLPGDQTRWHSLAEHWETMGLLRRTPEGNSYRISLSTRLGEVVRGKCSSCGNVSEAPKAMFLEPLSCPDCHAVVLFVLLPAKRHVATQG